MEGIHRAGVDVLEVLADQSLEATVAGDGLRGVVVGLGVTEVEAGQPVGAVLLTGGDVVLVVSGNFSAGGSHSIHIDPGSSLTIFVAGTTDLGASFEVLELGALPTRAPAPVNASGLPTFSIFSSNTSSSGVKLNGNGKLTASIYATSSLR